MRPRGIEADSSLAMSARIVSRDSSIPSQVSLLRASSPLMSYCAEEGRGERGRGPGTGGARLSHPGRHGHAPVDAHGLRGRSWEHKLHVRHFFREEDRRVQPAHARVAQPVGKDDLRRARGSSRGARSSAAANGAHADGRGRGTGCGDAPFPSAPRCPSATARPSCWSCRHRRCVTLPCGSSDCGRTERRRGGRGQPHA